MNKLHDLMTQQTIFVHQPMRALQQRIVHAPIFCKESSLPHLPTRKGR
jgi:hypothetical protein